MSIAVEKRLERLDISNDKLLMMAYETCIMDTRSFFNEDGSFVGMHNLNYIQQAQIDFLDVSEAYVGVSANGQKKWIGRNVKVRLVNRHKDRGQLMSHLGLLQVKKIDVNINHIEVHTKVSELKEQFSITELKEMQSIYLKNKNKLLLDDRN